MLARNWGWIVARGVAAIVFGILAFAWPGITWLTLVMLFAAYAFIGGVATIVSAVSGSRRGQPRWGMLLLEGFLGVVVAVLAVMWPTTAILAFVWVAAVWAIVTGALELVAAVRLRRLIAHEWLLGLAGVLSMAFGFLLLIRPAVGALTIIWWFGAYAVVFGVALIGLGLRLRSWLRGSSARELPDEGLPQAR